MIRIRWTSAAADDLEGIVTHIRKDNPEAARQVAADVLEGLEKLLDFPSIRRPGKRAGTCELVFAPLPYIAVYRVTDSIVEVLRIWHGAQQRHQ